MSKVEEQLEEIHVGDTILYVNSEKVVVKVQHNEKWVWHGGVRVKHGKGNMRDIKLPPPLKLDRDIVEYLLEDRNAPDIVDEMIEEHRKKKQ
jgi:hypothetical protein